MTNAALKVAALQETIAEKLSANQESVAKAKSGRITWRWKANGTLEIKIAPEL